LNGEKIAQLRKSLLKEIAFLADFSRQEICSGFDISDFSTRPSATTTSTVTATTLTTPTTMSLGRKSLSSISHQESPQGDFSTLSCLE